MSRGMHGKALLVILVTICVKLHKNACIELYFVTKAVL